MAASTKTAPALAVPSNGANGENGAPRLVEGWRALPTLPAVLFQFLGLVADRETTDEQLAELIWTDPALLARAISAVNASTAERNLPAGQIRQAIGLLGRERLRQLAYTTPLLRSVEPMRTGFHPATFWERSLLCATACESLARQLGLTAPAQYYVAGLFHDIGYLKVLQEKPAALRTVIERWTAPAGRPARARVRGVRHGPLPAGPGAGVAVAAAAVGSARPLENTIAPPASPSASSASPASRARFAASRELIFSRRGRFRRARASGK